MNDRAVRAPLATQANLRLSSPSVEMLAGAATLSGMKVRDVIVNWPLQKWTPDDPSGEPLSKQPGDLRLLWFSAPDAGGWFRVTATDDADSTWSTFCRVENPAQWPVLEITLSNQLRESLKEIGGLDLLPPAADGNN